MGNPDHEEYPDFREWPKLKGSYAFIRVFEIPLPLYKTVVHPNEKHEKRLPFISVLLKHWIEIASRC